MRQLIAHKHRLVRSARRPAAAWLAVALFALLTACGDERATPPPAAQAAEPAPSATATPIATTTPPPAVAPPPSATVLPPPAPSSTPVPPTASPVPPPPTPLPPTTTTAPRQAPPAGAPLSLIPDEATAREAVELINAQRAANGCMTPLVAQDALTLAAERHSIDMAANDFLEHSGSDGSDPGRRISEAGYRWAPSGPDEPIWAENVAAGYTSAAEVVAGWMDSEGHRKNMLTCSFRTIGVAVVRRPESTYGAYWTADFASAPEP